MEIIQHKTPYPGYYAVRCYASSRLPSWPITSEDLKTVHTWCLHLCRRTLIGTIKRFRPQESIGTREKLRAGGKVGIFGKHWWTQIVWGQGVVHMRHGGTLSLR